MTVEFAKFLLKTLEWADSDKSVLPLVLSGRVGYDKPFKDYSEAFRGLISNNSGFGYNEIYTLLKSFVQNGYLVKEYSDIYGKKIAVKTDNPEMKSSCYVNYRVIEKGESWDDFLTDGKPYWIIDLGYSNVFYKDFTGDNEDFKHFYSNNVFKTKEAALKCLKSISKSFKKYCDVKPKAK